MSIRTKLLHIFFWVFTCLYVFDYMTDVFSLADAIYFTLFEITLLASLFYVNLYILIPHLLKRKKLVLYSFALLGGMAFSFLVYFFTGCDSLLLGDTLESAILSFVLNHSLFVFISFMIWFFSKYSEERIKNLQLEKDKLQLEISLLKSQISPHFLFNTLNNIYSLAVTKDDNTPKMLAATSDILRYYVNNGQQKLVPLNEEIELLKKYVSTQEMRKLLGRIEFNLDTKILDRNVLIPPFVLITLAENAFKHGNAGTESDAFILIDISTETAHVKFAISNSYRPKPSEGGVGLKNIRSQLDLLLDDQYELKTKESGGTYSVILTLNGKA